MSSHTGGMSPGTDEGASTIRTPSPTIASATGRSTAARGGRSFWTSTSPATTDIHPTLNDPQSDQQKHQSDARTDAVGPEPEAGASAFPAALTKVPLDRRELVDPRRDGNHARGQRPVRPVQGIEDILE
jgi:hypothetical protein